MSRAAPDGARRERRRRPCRSSPRAREPPSGRPELRRRAASGRRGSPARCRLPRNRSSSCATSSSIVSPGTCATSSNARRASAASAARVRPDRAGVLHPAVEGSVGSRRGCPRSASGGSAPPRSARARGRPRGRDGSRRPVAAGRRRRTSLRRSTIVAEKTGNATSVVRSHATTPTPARSYVVEQLPAARVGDACRGRPCAPPGRPQGARPTARTRRARRPRRARGSPPRAGGCPAARPVPFARKQPDPCGPGERKSRWTHSYGTQSRSPPMTSVPSIQRIERSGWNRDHDGRGSCSTSTTRATSRSSRYVASRRGRRTCSACHASSASMIPETLAETRSTPFPCETESERPFGRQTITTGMPTTSSPVTTATRVTPIRGRAGWSRSSVRSGSTVRCVPSRWSFSASASACHHRSRRRPRAGLRLGAAGRPALGHRHERRRVRSRLGHRHPGRVLAPGAVAPRRRAGAARWPRRPRRR